MLTLMHANVKVRFMFIHIHSISDGVNEPARSALLPSARGLKKAGGPRTPAEFVSW